jgi:hypothetical protein
LLKVWTVGCPVEEKVRGVSLLSEVTKKGHFWKEEVKKVPFRRTQVRKIPSQ